MVGILTPSLAPAEIRGTKSSQIIKRDFGNIELYAPFDSSLSYWFLDYPFNIRGDQGE